MLNHCESTVEELVWALIEPSPSPQDFLNFLEQFPGASEGRRKNARDRASELQGAELRGTEGTHRSLYPAALSVLQAVAQDTTDADLRNSLLRHLDTMAQLGVSIDESPWDNELQDNHSYGFRWLKLAADAGSLKACENLYYAFMQGKGTERNPQQALFYVRKAAEGGLPDAQWQLAAAHWFDGNGIEADHDEAFKWLSICATQGDARGLCFLGHAYLEGIGCVPDPSEAARLFAESAEMDYTQAIHALGRCYFNGEGIEKDPAKGIVLLRKAASRGDYRAMTDIALALANGEHVLTNFKEAMKWFLRAAHLGDRNAMYYIGRLYEDGYGVEQSAEEARRWTAMAAAKGHERALLWIHEHTPQKPEWLAEMIANAVQSRTAFDNDNPKDNP